MNGSARPLHLCTDRRRDGGRPPRCRGALRGRRAITVVAWFFIVTAILFGLLWLSEDVPALLAGVRPHSLTDTALPTIPVHILDLGFVLPAGIATSVLLHKRRLRAHTIEPASIEFPVLTGMPILITPVVKAARGEMAN